MARTPAPRILFAALAILFFGAPVALRVAGVTAHAFENRRLAPAPRLTEGWAFFDETTRFLIDRMPLRDQAVHANTWIDRHIFATTPQYGLNGLGGVPNDQALPFTGRPDQDKASLGSATTTKGSAPVQPPATADQVSVGRDGWLYLQGVFDRACSPFMPFSQAASRWESLVQVIRHSGRRVALFVAPDKSTVYPEHVAPNALNVACSRPGTQALWRIIESPAAARAGIVGLRRPLLAQKQQTSDLLYYRTDSHWNRVGSLALVEAALPRFGPTVRVLPSEVVDTGPKRYTGDLLGLLGQSGSEIAPTRRIRRSPGAPVVPGRTVIVGDSYVDSAMAELTPYFASTRLIFWTNSTAQQIANAIADSDNVLLETVEREFDYRALDSAYITPKFIALVRATLAAHVAPGH